MSKTSQIKTENLEKIVMHKVNSNEITMKPRWYFIAGSILTLTGFIAFTITAVYLINLILFLLKTHGPMGQYRFMEILTSLPLWIPVLALIGIIGGIFILRKFDFSYKKNFWFIIFAFIVSIIFASLLFDYLGLNDIFARQGPMRGFYRQLQPRENNYQPKSPGMNKGQNRFFIH